MFYVCRAVWSLGHYNFGQINFKCCKMLYFLSRYPTLQITVFGVICRDTLFTCTLSKQMVRLIVAKLSQHLHGQPTLHVNAVNTRISIFPPLPWNNHPLQIEALTYLGPLLRPCPARLRPGGVLPIMAYTGRLRTKGVGIS